MRVMCIDNTAKTSPECIGNFMVKEGHIYNVCGEFDHNGEHFYQLQEDSGGNGWNSIYFIHLSDFDADLKHLLNTKPNHKKFKTKNYVR